MKRVAVVLGSLALGASAANAGGIDRSGQSVGIIFEAGNYVELSYGAVNPVVKGNATFDPDGPGPAPMFGNSGDLSAAYSQIGVSAKMKINDQLDAAIIMDQPFGASVDYPIANYFAAGSLAKLNTNAITGVVKYRTASNLSVYGGLRYQTLSARARVPFVASYSVNGESDAGVGYLVGAAWEKPEIALRVALTYNSKINHKLDTSETFLHPLAGVTSVSSVTQIVTPESLTLDAQTGIAKDTLLFGSARWVDWSSFNISPATYTGSLAGSPLVAYREDTINYTLGIGRRFNENWSGAISIGYEKPTGGASSNLGPTDGRKSLTIGATYTKDAMKITAGVSYIDIGNTYTSLGAAVPVAAVFRDNSAVAAGIKVGFSF